MHNLQKILLKRLLVQNNQKYGSLAVGYDFEDNIVFHLNQLLSADLIQKESGVYSITLSGVKEIAKYESEQLENKGVKQFFIGFHCHDGKGSYLVKSHPQAKNNFYNLPSGKPFFGEDIEEALKRGFLSNTGLEIEGKDFTFMSLHLKTIQSIDGEVIFDDAFTIYSLEVNEKQKNEMHLGENILWLSEDQIEKLNNKWPEIDLCILKKDNSPYTVYKHISDYIL